MRPIATFLHAKIWVVPAPEILERMKEDWNSRAREDAHYYAAFGRHQQSEEEFYATAAEVVYALECELRRLPQQAPPKARRALEIGCGPGRLMRFMSRHFGEIHGIDVSDEMVRLARQRLQDVPGAYVHTSSGATLEQFADESFDFVYSYAVFQHIPDRAIVWSYLQEARRVLRTGGLFWFQANNLPADTQWTDTWCGVRFTPEELLEFAERNDFQVYTLEGRGTQYMTTSWRKREAGWKNRLPDRAAARRTRICSFANRYGLEPVAATRGRYAAASLSVAGLPEAASLNHLGVRVDGRAGLIESIGPPLPYGMHQLNIVLPEGVRSGMVPVELTWFEEPLGEAGWLRLIAAPPQAPRLLGVADGEDLLAGTQIVSGMIRVMVEEVLDPAELRVSLDGQIIPPAAIVTVEPRAPRHDLYFRIPNELSDGEHQLEVRHRKHRFPAVRITLQRAPKQSTAR
jgi:SAM-dependent methyltransferase